MSQLLQIIIPSLIIGIAVATAIIYFWQKQKKELEEKAGQSFENLSNKVLTENISRFLDLAKKELEAKRQEFGKDLENKENAIQKVIDRVQKDLLGHQEELRKFEADRNKKYGQLSALLEDHKGVTEKLRLSTERFNQILSNSRLRGQWGERIAEDILRNCGLIENTHYQKNKRIEGGQTRPDYTFFLPDGHKVNMDVKFPLENLMKATDIEDKNQQEIYKKNFVVDVRQKIKEVTSRDYINPSENTLDYVLLFVPIERIFSHLNDEHPEVIEEAMRKSVILISPFSLFAILRIIHQSFINFHYEQSTKKIIDLINNFLKDFELFKNRFGEFDKRLLALRSLYDDISDKSFKRLDKKIEKIEDYRKGAEMETIADTEQQKLLS